MTATDGIGNRSGHDAPDPSAPRPAPGPAVGHVIVYGVRGVGLRTVEHLHAAGVDTVVVAAGADDTDPVADALLASWGVPRVTVGSPPAKAEAAAEG